jgi:hypothetical protein
MVNDPGHAGIANDGGGHGASTILPGEECIPEPEGYIHVNNRLHTGDLIAFHFVPQRSRTFRRQSTRHEKGFGSVKVLGFNGACVPLIHAWKEDQTQ